MSDLTLTTAEQEDVIASLERIDERLDALAGRIKRIVQQREEGDDASRR